MNEQLDQLRKTYRDITAPPHLATRIRAEIGDRPLRRRAWIPAGAAIMFVVAAAVLVPYIAQQSATTSSLPNKPSLAAVAALQPDRPAGMTTSLTRVRTVPRPKMPSKPGVNSIKPQTKLDTETEFLKEEDNALS